MKFFRRLLYLISVFLPLALLVNTKAFFYSATDWNNSLWLTGYIGHYIKTHFSAPIFLNADNAVGIPINLFYGYLLYPVLGFISSVVGASLALRIGCLLMLAFQFFGILSGSRAIFRHRAISYATTITVIWGTYTLTNLYNRSAISEYFATGFMMACIGFMFAAAEELNAKGRIFFVWMAAVSMLMSIGIHPPTAFLETLFFILLLLIIIKTWCTGSKYIQLGKTIGLSLTSIGFILILVPWVYIMRKIGPSLTQWSHPGVMLFYPDRCDTWLKRLSPITFDWLTTQQGTQNVSTPYLEAPIDFGLLILLIWGVYESLKKRTTLVQKFQTLFERAALSFTYVSIIWGIFLFILSVYKPLATHFLFLAPFVQFAYRLTSHINATLLVGVFSIILIIRQKGLLEKYRAKFNILAAICITIASLNLINKLPHAQVITSTLNSPEYEFYGDRSSLARNGQSDLAIMYATSKLYPELAIQDMSKLPQIKLPVGYSGNTFGIVSDLDVTFKNTNWVITNVIAFPWSRIVVNGQRIGGDNLSRVGGFFAVKLPAGNSHIHWQLHEDPYWKALYAAGHICFLGMVFYTLILFTLAILSKIKFSVYAVS